jgi:hypothetical protein
MGEKNSVFIFKGPPIDRFRRTLAAVVRQLGGRLDWNLRPEPMHSNLLTSHNKNVHAAYINVKGYEIATLLGATLAVPWINVRIQEGALWDYSLYDGENNVDNFSVLPEYWGQSKAWESTQRGQPKVLSRLWTIELRKIDKYLKPWGFRILDDHCFETLRRGKAYRTDKSEYGDIWQMTDFLRALGAHDPNWGEPHSVSRGLTFAGRGSRSGKSRKSK